MTVAQQAAWDMMVSYLGAETTDDDEAVRFAIAVKEEAKLRTDGGASLVTTIENNDIIFPVIPMTSIKGFCKRKSPSV